MTVVTALRAEVLSAWSYRALGLGVMELSDIRYLSVQIECLCCISLCTARMVVCVSGCCSDLGLYDGCIITWDLA